MKTQNLKLSAIFIAIFYLSSTAFTLTDLPRSKGKWVTYESEVEKIKIKFPGEIIVIDEVLEGGQHHINVKYQPLSGNLFMLDVVEHIPDMNESENLDQASLDSFFTQMGVFDAPYEDYFLEDNKGSKALIPIDELGVTVDYRVVIIGQQQIQTIVVMRSNQWDQKVVNKFFKSLKLLK